MNSVLASVSAAIVSIISAGGLPGIVVLMALESACIPIPSEIVMPFGGYLVSTGQFSLLGVATAGAVGCNLGSAIAYLAGARGGRALVERLGSHSLFGMSELTMAERFFDRFGSVATFLGRLLPVIRTFIALPAGMARMNVWAFHAYTFAGSWLWCYALAYVGKSLGNHWEDDPRLKWAFHGADVLIVVALLIAVAWFVIRRRKFS